MIKKIMKNKLFLYFTILLDIIFVIFLLNIPISKTNAIFFIILFHLIVLIIFFYFCLRVPIINVQKIYDKIIIKNKRKKISKDEIYIQDIDIETFDGSGSLTHPSVVYFENGFNGYKYWMVYTPYDDNNVELENPSLAVSNDGINFETLNEMKNPLLKIIKMQKPNTYYNDPFIMFDNNRLEIWYRYTIEDISLINDVYRIISSDGINWSKPEKMISNDGSCYMSLSIVKKDNLYYLYYFNMNYEFNLRTSKDLKKWSREVTLKVNNFNGKFWHGEVRKNDSCFELMFIDRNYELYHAISYDSLNFEKLEKYQIYYAPKEYFYKNKKIYKPSFLYIKDKFVLYVPINIMKLNMFNIKKVFHKKWKLTVTILNVNRINDILKIK